MTDRYVSSSNNPYSENQWLENHHSIKARLRTELVSKLPLRPGDNVLDIGCGTGSWTFLIADQVGHGGYVLGIDLDEESISFASDRKKYHHHSPSIDFQVYDALEFQGDRKFDVVTLFNSLSYVDEPERIFQKLPDLLNPGGSILVKDADLGSDFFWPVEGELYHTLMSNILENRSKRNDSYYNPFFARNIPKLIHESKFEFVETFTQSFVFNYPVDERQRKYISENARMIADFTDPVKCADEIQRWLDCFDDQNGECIFFDKNFLYSMLEFVFHARMPSIS